MLQKWMDGVAVDCWTKVVDMHFDLWSAALNLGVIRQKEGAKERKIVSDMQVQIFIYRNGMNRTG